MIRTCLAILLSSLLLSIAAFAIEPDGPISLWQGYDVPHGEEVQMYVFRPDNPSGIGVVVCPGGSYHWLDEKGEGLDVGKWLSSNGITAFVLFYRTAGAAEVAWHTRILFRGKRHPDMLTDAQRSLQYVWDNSEQYGVDRHKIGMIGFSAGGHLALSAACFHTTNFLENTAGIQTDADLRPSFVASIYPVVTMEKPYAHNRSRRGLLGDNRIGSKTMRDSLSIERHIPSDCPPVFVINCMDDPVVRYENSELLDSALTRQGIPHKYIQYKQGKHGFGVSDYYGSSESREWKNEFLIWVYDTLGMPPYPIL